MAVQPVIQGFVGCLTNSKEVVIANAAQSSAAIECRGFTLVGIKLPAAFTGVALTFEACDTLGGTYVAVKKADGSDLSYVVAQNTYVIIDPKDFYGIEFLKIKSGSAEGGARTLICSLKGF